MGTGVSPPAMTARTPSIYLSNLGKGIQLQGKLLPNQQQPPLFSQDPPFLSDRLGVLSPFMTPIGVKPHGPLVPLGSTHC